MHEATGEKCMKQLINSLWIEIEKKISPLRHSGGGLHKRTYSFIHI